MTGRDKDRVVQEAEHYRRKGYAAGLDDAREAIRNAKRIRCADDALAAIDALREKK